MSAPVTLIISTMTGLVFMMLPDQMNIPIQSSLADLNHLCGALIVVVAVISMGEVVRPLRFLNVLAGAALVIIPWLLITESIQLKMIDVIGGIIVVACSIPRGIKKEKYGLWDKYVL
jgi:hypothetical protein